jgi:hypothetical protein
MNGFVDPNGLSQKSGIQAALRTLGKGFAMEVVRCHTRYLAGDHQRLDGAGRSYYSTSGGTIVFSQPTGPPWFALVQLLQEA